ncbi:TPA: hypothetical protein ACOEA2_002551 [Enterobacter cloacae]
MDLKKAKNAITWAFIRNGKALRKIVIAACKPTGSDAQYFTLVLPQSANPVCYHRKATNKPLSGGFFVAKIPPVSPLHHA